MIYELMFIGRLIFLFKLYKRWAKTLTSKRLFIEILRRTSSLLSLITAVLWDGVRWTTQKYYKTQSTFRKIPPLKLKNMISTLSSNRRIQSIEQRTNSSSLSQISTKKSMKKEHTQILKLLASLWQQPSTMPKHKLYIIHYLVLRK